MMTDKKTGILLVEDDPMDAELTIRALKEKHITNPIHLAGDGEKALEFIYGSGRNAPQSGRSHPNLILLDLKLPKVDGLEVLEQLKRDPETRSIPVVILTSSQQEPDIQRCYALGANSYIVKPVNFEKFIQAVGEIGLYWLLLNQPPPCQTPDRTPHKD